MRCALHLLRLVDLARLQARQQLVGRNIDQHDFIGFIEYGIRQGFRDADTGDPADHIVQAFQVLHVDGGEYIDAGIQQFLYVLPALRMTRAGRIRMRQFIDQDQFGMAFQRGIDVELGDRLAAIVDGL